jgi:hypothetical protein
VQWCAKRSKPSRPLPPARRHPSIARWTATSLLEVEALSEGLRVLPIQSPDRSLLEPVERQRRGDRHGDVFDFLRLCRHRFEAGHIFEVRHHVEVEVVVRRIVAHGRVVAEQVGCAYVVDVRVVFVCGPEGAPVSDVLLRRRMKMSRSSVADQA